MFVVTRLADFAAKIGDSLKKFGYYAQEEKEILLAESSSQGHGCWQRLFVRICSGSKNGKSTSFFCTMCERDVSIESRGSGEINRHFASDRHWERDVTYRVHKGLRFYNQFRQAITLTDVQLADYQIVPLKKKDLVTCFLKISCRSIVRSRQRCHF